MNLESVLKSTILEALLEKITSIQNKSIHNDAVEAFTKIIISEPESARNALRLILYNIQSPNEWKALQALYLLEACMQTNCDTFQTEVGKFRFLNELIKLVSPKYLGNLTSTGVKNKIVDLLMAWSERYPKETKIKEALDMLIKQGVIDKSSKKEERPLNVTSRTIANNNLANCYDENDEKSIMLQKLLRSNKPNDLRAANHLIKTMVKEKEEKDDLRLLSNNVRLLAEMLSNITADSSSEDFELVKELKETCVNMKPTLSYFISSCSKATKETSELFELNDLLNNTLQLYHERMLLKEEHTRNPKMSISNKRTNSPTLLDFTSPVDDIPCILPFQPEKLSVASAGNSENDLRIVTKSDNEVRTLEEIFSTTYCISDGHKKDCSTELFQDLNVLGKSLLESNVHNSLSSSDISKLSVDELGLKSNDESRGIVESISSDDQILSEDDELVNGINEPEMSKNCPFNEWKSNEPSTAATINRNSIETGYLELVEPLSDIHVPLIDIKTDDNEKVPAFEDVNGINVYVQLTKNKPRKDVSVFLVLSNSRKTEPITNFLFQPVIPKDCRLKLQPSSRCELPPFNPHIPSETIVQIMLIASFNKDRIPLKFVVSYSIKDEMITELGEIPSLPLR